MRLLQLSVGCGLVLTAACAGPSRSELKSQAEEVKRLQSAHAVYLPKTGDSCVGVTLRLAADDPAVEAERKQFSVRFRRDEIDAALRTAQAERCAEVYRHAAIGAKTGEPLRLNMAYGIGEDGRVCAVVERVRDEPFDPIAVGLFDDAAQCVKETLFKAQFPAGRVHDKERAIFLHAVYVDPTKSSIETRTPTVTPAR